MGFERHHAILVTSYEGKKRLKKVKAVAEAVGCKVIGPSDDVINGYSTLCVVPDGSKEGWEESDRGDDSRSKFIAYLVKQGCFDWVEVAYGHDDNKAWVTCSAYGKEN